MYLLYRIYNQICRKLIQSKSNKHVLGLASCEHEHRFSLTLVCSCQRICDLSYELFSLSSCPGERICLLPEKNPYFFFFTIDKLWSASPQFLLSEHFHLHFRMEILLSLPAHPPKTLLYALVLRMCMGHPGCSSTPSSTKRLSAI